MFGFIKKISIGLLSICTTPRLVESLASNCEASIKRVSLNNRPCQARLALIQKNSNETLYF